MKLRLPLFSLDKAHVKCSIGSTKEKLLDKAAGLFGGKKDQSDSHGDDNRGSNY